MSKCLIGIVLALTAPLADACSVHIPPRLYVNVVRLEGPKIEGLSWSRTWNILGYEGSQRVFVSRVREGKRSPLVKWEGGQLCFFDEAGLEKCSPNQPGGGVRFEGLFEGWIEASDRRDELKKLYFPLVVELHGRETLMVLRSRPVRSTRELQSERAARFTVEACDLVNGVETGS